MKKISKALRETVDNFNKLKEEVGNKAASEEVSSALNYVNAQLRRLANDSVLREQLDLVLRSKVDKKDLHRLAHAIAGFGDVQENSSTVIASRMACLSCNRPLKTTRPQTVEGGGRSATAPAVGGGGDTGPVYEVPLNPLRSPPGTAPARTRERPLSSQSDNSDQITAMDGTKVSRYSRVLPAPSRVRSAAGGGGPGHRGNKTNTLQERMNRQLLDKLSK